MSSNPPRLIDFQREFEKIIQEAQYQKQLKVEIKSSDLHRRVGSYPSHNHRMPVCCRIMRKNMLPGDCVLSEPLNGDGATLVIRYYLPRDK